MNFFHRYALVAVLAVSAFSASAQLGLADLLPIRRMAKAEGTSFQQSLEMAVRPAYIIQSHAYLRGDNPDSSAIRKSFSGHLKYGFKLPETSLANAVYRDATQGIGIAAFTFSRPKEIGNPVALFAYQSAPIWNISNRLSLDYEWNFGASFGWKPYNPETNSAQHITGTKTNAYLNVSMLLNWRLSSHVGMNAGIAMTHFSNGNTGIPNTGLNTAALNVGIVYNFTPQITTAKSEEELPIPEFPRHISYDLVVFGSYCRSGATYNDAAQMSPDRYPVVGFNFNPMYNVNYRFRAGASLDGTWDSSGGLQAVLTESGLCSIGGECTEDQFAFVRTDVSKQFSLGLSARLEYVMPFFSINAGIGHSLYAGDPKQRGLYQTLALKTAITRNLFLHVGYRLHKFHEPNYLMIGFGYRFHNLFPRLR